MYKLCKTERSAQRQRKIEAVFLSLMAQKDYDQISVTEICEAMDMPRKAFYRYFDSKEDALQALIDHTLSDFQKTQPTLTGKRPRSLVGELEQFFIFWQAHQVMLDTLDRNQLTGTLMQRCVDFPTKDEGLCTKFLPDDEEWARPHIIQFAASGLHSLMLRWYRTGFEMDTKSMAALAARMLHRPLFPSLESIGFSK